MAADHHNLITDVDMKQTFNYVVDYISAKRVSANGKVEYLVKWEGYDGRQSTWETVDQFASPQVVDIFEHGLSSQMASRVSTKQALTAAQDSCPVAAKSVPKSVGRPKSVKPVEDKRRKRRGRKDRRIDKPNILFGGSTATDADNRMEVLHAIKTYETLMGVSNRKSRMSCPSTPTKVKVTTLQASNTPTLRTQRYRTREQQKSEPFTQTCLSVESNGSHEENKNPLKSHNNL